MRLFRNPAQPLPRCQRHPHAAQPSALEARAWLTHGPYISGLGGRAGQECLLMSAPLYFFFFASRNVRPVWGGMWCLIYNKLSGAVHTILHSISGQALRCALPRVFSLRSPRA